MVNNISKKLYKYHVCSIEALQNLSQNKLWFSKPGRFNDPFDCAIPFNIDGSEKEYLELYNNLVNRLTEPGRLDKIKEVESRYLTDGKPNLAFKHHTNEVQLKGNLELIKSKFSQMGVACFSEKLDDILMWSHYANGHRGFCLEFDTYCEPFQNIDNIQIQKVIYSDSYPLLSPAAVTETKYMPIEPLITKSTDWKDEKEWRLLMSPEGDPSFKYELKTLTAIYFGCSMPDEQIELICTILSKPTPNLYKMQQSNTEFKLISVPYQCL